MAPDLVSLVAPGRTALLLQELQQGVVGTASALPALAQAAADAGVIANAVVLATAARSAGVPVVHCTAENLHGGFGVNRNARLFAGARRAGAENVPGSDSVAPVPELGPEAGDVVVPRYHGLSPLTGSSLDTLLRNEGIASVVVAGVSTNLAIPNLVFDAVNRSYQVVLVTDAVAGVPAAFTDEIIRNSLALVATLATADDVATVWTQPSAPG
jgi:nicotinamidase-related amidase